MNDQRKLYFRWIGANALGELFGLGGTFAVGILAFTKLGDQPGGGTVLAMFGIAVVSGAIEATVVGFLQWLAMSPWFPAIRLRAWWLGTLGGALAAYLLGYLPSTLMSLGEEAAQTPAAAVQEPAQWVILLLAAGMGLAAGAVLSFAQWLVLRKAVKRAGGWIPANMLAWMVGMPIIFWGIDMAQKGQPLIQALLLMAGVLLATGAVVGAIHGAWLVRLAKMD